MNWKPSILLFLLLASAFAALFNGYLLLNKRQTHAPGAKSWALLMFSAFIWTVGYIIELYAHQLDEKFLGLCLEYLFGIPFAPVLWFVAAIKYSSAGQRPKKYEIRLLFIIPTITMLLMWTTNLHGYYYYNFRVEEYKSFRLLAKNWGIWFYINLVYDYLALLVGTITLAFSLRKYKNIYRTQVILFLIGISLPWVANLLYVSGMNSYMRIDITPIAFIFSVALLRLAIYRYSLFDLIPAAYDKVIESVRSGIIVVDSNERIIEINPAAQKIFNNVDAIGKEIHELLEGLKITWDVDEPKQSEIFEIEIGSSIYELAVVDVTQNTRGNSGKIFTFYDITERKNTQKKLSESNSAKDKFFSIIAHDLKNPFFGMIGLSNILLEDFADLNDEEKQSMLYEIVSLAENTHKMLENLLTWSRQQTGRIDFAPKSFEVISIVEDNILFAQQQAKVKNISLVYDVQTQTKVFADENMASTILRNLISNAIKFTGQNGKVEVAVCRENDFAAISVKDSGVGMDEKKISKLFRIDTDVKSIGTAGEKGTGLGLLLCKEFAEKNGGTISVISTPAMGSIFTFTLPISK